MRQQLASIALLQDGAQPKKKVLSMREQVIIPHHETFSTTIQPPYSSTKGWII